MGNGEMLKAIFLGTITTHRHIPKVGWGTNLTGTVKKRLKNLDEVLETWLSS